MYLYRVLAVVLACISTAALSQDYPGKPVRIIISFTAGGMNIFDEYPDEWNAQNAFPFPQLGFIYGWETVPFGINGGYYFARLGYRFDH